jgi:hypothetical protein
MRNSHLSYSSTKASKSGAPRDSWIETPPVGRCVVRIPAALAQAIREDLRQPHEFAFERVGFVSVATGHAADGELILIATQYHSVPDNQYIESSGVGARIGATAIRQAMQETLASGRGMFHVHLHDHRGVPDFSGTDRSEQPRLIPSFIAVTSAMPHGMLLLSEDRATAWVWMPGEHTPSIPRRTVVVGYPMQATDVMVAAEQGTSATPEERFDRQSFLGRDSDGQLGSTRVAVIGYGGGGSHIGLQAVHLGIHRQRIFDGDYITGTNHNRLVGGLAADIVAKTAKTEIARRVIMGVDPGADVEVYPDRWQNHAEVLRGCDVIIGCVDTFAARHELEVFSRRYMIPYIDIGMDVRQFGDEPPRMGGQLILSMPGRPCMTCLGFLSPARLAAEAAKYGNTGGRPQVIWPNGVLASTAVGVMVDLVTGWTRQVDRMIYYSYDGNASTVTPHVRLQYLLDTRCPHYDSAEVGDPIFQAL